MIIISHRGNLHGPDPVNENHPDYILNALECGFEAEVDVWMVENFLRLGHDSPQHFLSQGLMYAHQEILFHAKDIASAKRMANTNWHFFCHQQDPFALTSKGYIWQHDLTLPLTDRSIIPLMTWESIHAHQNWNVHAVCTDYPIELKRILEERRL